VARVKQAYANPAVLKAAIGYYCVLDLKGIGSGGANIACPALLAAGSADFVPEAQKRSIRGFEASVVLWVADGAGHWPHRELQDEFVARLLAFLGTVSWD
jgi:pimeloyl-ACP methyl ester carboxylesterase